MNLPPSIAKDLEADRARLWLRRFIVGSSAVAILAVSSEPWLVGAATVIGLSHGFGEGTSYMMVRLAEFFVFIYGDKR